MGLIIGLVFVGVFAAIALPLIATSVGPSKQAKDVQTRLASALATEMPAALDIIVNLRKHDQISSIPWLNKKLLQFELFHRLSGGGGGGDGEIENQRGRLEDHRLHRELAHVRLIQSFGHVGHIPYAPSMRPC